MCCDLCGEDPNGGALLNIWTCDMPEEVEKLMPRFLEKRLGERFSACEECYNDLYPNHPKIWNMEELQDEIEKEFYKSLEATKKIEALKKLKELHLEYGKYGA